MKSPLSRRFARLWVLSLSVGLSAGLLAVLSAGLAIGLTACRKDSSDPPSDSDTSPVTATVATETSVATEPDESDAVTEPETWSETGSETGSVTESETEPTELMIIPKGQLRFSKTVLIHGNIASSTTDEAAYRMLTEMRDRYLGTKIPVGGWANAVKRPIQFIFGSDDLPPCAELIESLDEGEYALKLIRMGAEADAEAVGKVAYRLVVAYTNMDSAKAAIEDLFTNYMTDEGLVVPMNLDVRGRKEYTVITTTIDCLRDPCVLVEDGVYYMYGTGWNGYKNTSGSLEGPWEYMGVVASVSDPNRDGGDHWAPEVHKYNGAYYMFTTYKNKETGRHGCTIMKADTPEGPFVEISNGTVTPAEWDAIDGTFYVDPDGQPWMVFVHEWVSAPQNVGSFAAAKLSDDLTHFISEPFELFKANEPSWTTANVTDGCWMYTTAEGELLMIWSNFGADGYRTAIARSSNGRLDGEWIHEEQLLYAQYMTGTYDGGHGMIFTDTDGQMYLSIHSPNNAVGERREKPVFIAIEEKDGTLVWASKESNAE